MIGFKLDKVVSICRYRDTDHIPVISERGVFFPPFLDFWSFLSTVSDVFSLLESSLNIIHFAIT